MIANPGLLRTVLVALLDATPDFVMAGEVDPDGDVESVLAARRPDLLLVDFDAVGAPSASAGWCGVDGCPVVALTARCTVRALRQALGARVRGVVAKDVPPEELLDLLRAVARGQRMIDPLMALAALDAAVNPLSERERQVAAAAAEGLRTSEIAAQLYLSPGTVRNHLSTLLRKTGARNRWEAVQRARDACWI
ncbi:DNA-binding response regulator [Micromonospora qiuiae]|uniref:DNA-binding response regulator n=1 Tax=Micromonospora qiuiae TaxID=502268 RepID=A0ABQ4JHZ2_9ACTN|nr:DNA-binding response regulator [Micromonospora qiuiae]